jgi:DnaJ-domain-containing protein 1
LLYFTYSKKYKNINRHSNNKNTYNKNNGYNSGANFENFYNKRTGKDGYNDHTNNYNVWNNKSKYYKILNIPLSSTLEEVKKAYRNLIKQHHPDKFMNASQDEKKYHEKKMKEINEAYDYIVKLYQ